MTPTLTSHSVDRNVNAEFKFNQETEFIPIIGLAEAELNKANEPAKEVNARASSIQSNHHPAILSLLSEELNVTSESIHDFELYVDNLSPTDVQR